MKNSMKRIVKAVIGYGMVAIILIGVIAVLAIFGGAIMGVFGFEYDSVRSMILFFVVVAVAGFPLETLALALPRALRSLGRMTTREAKILFVILDVIATMITMTVIDYFMSSVRASDLAILVIAVLMAVTSMKDVDKGSEADT